ncbi:ankyrin repeat protein, putative [Trichomonas vaginalis G3]|uniref:Ankyrin repeat protein, putative n=1 Tax=Trichomonas vaginalis (strain ATCC PRA-98 / G3) TaxID=412133 RepID=A2EGD3_TRIV3|nr:ankyrin repeat and SOCS box-containing protein 4 family [Trichomonas vaginalis G3]EAY08312.1 ankyrin repeat protein, putative [Trichomonas vaginalis G3]KAI5546087.1 ankyrin repeat and SOCS box-containing protein 4 family [Trichomonas vaginalis G3]|eukprot:XP_001320535.1 ankyrin repeat protein [Trichomonas vaginalis G3]
MSYHGIYPNQFIELRSIHEYYIDTYNALYQLKTENEEELNNIYIMIKTMLANSKKSLPKKIIKDILNIIPYNNRYAKSYLKLAKLIYDDYHVQDVNNVANISNYLFYQKYGIQLLKTDRFAIRNYETLDIHTQDTIYKAIAYNDKERFISFTESKGFDENQKLQCDLYPDWDEKYSLLELCCYHGAVDCFKFLRTKFNAEITYCCLKFSFLGGNPEIMSECLKYQTPYDSCMWYAIISHNIDFVTFLMNEYNIKIDLLYCEKYKNLEAFLVYFDQTNDVNICFVYSTAFDIQSLYEYFLSHGANINGKKYGGKTVLHIAVEDDRKDTVEFLISHGANINEKDDDERTPLFYAAICGSEESTEFLISHGANINEKDKYGKPPLFFAITKHHNEIAEFLISHGANINEKDNDGKTALHYAIYNKYIETAELLILHGANINEKDYYGQTALHYAADQNNKEIIKFLISHGANINEKDKYGKTPFLCNRFL